MQLDKLGTVYFIGIGGIGMSALARFFLGKGVAVYGYDRTETPLTRLLVSEGAKIHYTEDLSLLPDPIDLAIYTPAVPDQHKELSYIRKSGTPLKKRAEVLGMISREFPTLAVAGTHGKTTTSSILAWLLYDSGVPVNAFLGGIAGNFESNYVGGPAEWIIVEADEYDRSFLHLYPKYAAILSMDADHLDIYGDAENIHHSGFFAFARQVSPDGGLLVQNDWVSSLSGDLNPISFGVEKGAYRAERIRVAEGFMVFDLVTPDWTLPDFRLALPGRHNVENAVAALTLAVWAGGEPEKLKHALPRFRGVKRRFDIRYRKDEVVYIDDYAHHPTELKAAVSAAREFFPGRKVTGIFQPHLFSRTRDFADGFAEAMDSLDECVLLDIYPAREKPIPGVTSDTIARKMQRPGQEVLGLGEVLSKLEEKEFEILLTLGAGNIDTLVGPIESLLEARFGPGEKIQ